MVKVLIAEDNVPISVHLSNVINFTKEVQAISIVNNGAEVYQTIKSLKPEIVILDLNLPGEDGIEILKKIEEDAELKTRVVIYSGEPTYMARVKGFKSVERFFNKIQPCEEIGLEIQRIAKDIENEELAKKIYDLLLKMGFRAEHKGTQFIKECIEMSTKEKQENLKKIYEKIASIEGKTPFTIKADIQLAVNKMWRYANREKVRKFLRLGESDKPSPKIVVSMVRYYVEMWFSIKYKKDELKKVQYH